MKQKFGKFDDLARNRVIDAIREHEGVKLQRVGLRTKWLRDASGRNWWVLGGRETWHGIPEEMMEDEKRSPVEGLLVIACQKRASMDVFKGPLGPLVSASDGLPRATQPPRDYNFNVEVSGTRMWVKEAKDIVLARFVTIPWSADDRERDCRRHEFRKLVSAMSPEEIAVLMDKLRIRINAAPAGR